MPKSQSWLIVVIGIALVALLAVTSRDQAARIEETVTNSVWTVDVVHTLPGKQAEYLRNIETNWASARQIARGRGAILSYRALAAEPDSLGNWDILLMTEYADSLAWMNREETFDAIFASPEFVRTPIDSPSSELRSFIEGGGVLRTLVSSP